MDPRQARVYKQRTARQTLLVSQIWSNDNWLAASEFQISPLDRGLTLGLGLFETMLANDGQPVFLERHLARYAKGCQRLGWQPGNLDFHEIIVELLARNLLQCGRAKIRLAMTAGGGSVYDGGTCADRKIWLTAAPLEPLAAGVSVNLATWPKNERSPLAGLKCASYAENVLALVDAQRLGFDETLFFNSQQQLCEAAMANVFLIKNGQLRTPSLDSGCLPGVTREVVLGLGQSLLLKPEQTILTAADLLAADEIFLTSALRGVVNVVKLGDRPYSETPITEQLQHAWNDAVSRGSHAAETSF